MKHWIKLDNAAKIYPPIRKKNWSAMFRISAELTDEVDPEILEVAQKHILKRFPSFGCRLEKGFFWYYLERIDGAPPVTKDVYNPMRKLDPDDNNGFMYRLLYYKKRIAVEFFHVLSDGTGGLTFFLSLLNEYVFLKYGKRGDSSKYILRCDEAPVPEEYEDSFLKYSPDESLSRREAPSYHTSGTPAPNDKLFIISAKVSTDQLKEAAKNHNMTLGAFIAALMLYSVYRKQRAEKSSRKRKKLLKVSVPINLRNYFKSTTVRNFSSYVNVGIESKLGEYSFDEICEQVKHQLALHLNKKELAARFSANVSAERNIIVRIMPLFLKIIALKIVYMFQGDRYFASQISNLGLVELPDEIEPYISRLDLILGRSQELRSDCAVISFKGNTYLNFSRTTVEADIEKYFLCDLVKMGVHVYIESNGRD